MESNSLWIFLACAFAAEVIGTMAGFGAATVLTPIASFFMEIKTAVAVVACFHLFGNASRIAFFWRDLKWAIVRQFGLAAVLRAQGSEGQAGVCRRRGTPCSWEAWPPDSSRG